MRLDSLYNAGVIWGELGEWGKAEEYYGRCIEEAEGKAKREGKEEGKGGSVGCLLNMASVMSRKGEWRKAKELLVRGSGLEGAEGNGNLKRALGEIDGMIKARGE